MGLPDLPAYAWPFILAVAAAVSSRLVARRVDDDTGSLPGYLLYAVAVGSVVVGLATWWLSYHA